MIEIGTNLANLLGGLIVAAAVVFVVWLMARRPDA